MSENSSDSSQEGKENDQASTEQKGKSKKRLFIVIIAIVLLVIIVAGGFFAWKKNYLPFLSSSKHDDAHKTEQQHQAGGGVFNKPLLLGIPSATANLDNGNGKTIYVKMTARVEIEGAPNLSSLQDRVPEIQDVFQTYLHETRPQDLHGSGFYRLKEALLRRLRASLAPLKVTNIYITELLTQ